MTYLIFAIVGIVVAIAVVSIGLAWPAGDGDEVRHVEVIELDKVLALLDRKDCGGGDL